jgi:hypothetical protein
MSPVCRPGADNGAPGPRPYGDNYYAAFVLDPEGNNVEAVCTTGSPMGLYAELPRAAQRLAALSSAFWASRSFCEIRTIASTSSSSSGSMRYRRIASSSVRATFSL